MDQNITSTQQLLSTLQTYGLADLDKVGNIVEVLKREAYNRENPASANATRQATDLPVFDVPPEYLVNYHVLYFQAFIEQLFANNEDYYAISSPYEMTNNSSLTVNGPWNDNSTKTGQVPRVIVEAESCGLSQAYMGDRSDRGITSALNKSTEHSSCWMSTGMLIQVIAGKPMEATNLANVILMSIAKTRAALRHVFALYNVGWPVMSPAAQMDDNPGEKFLATVRLTTTKSVHWNESMTEKAYRHVIYRLVGNAIREKEAPVIQMLWNSPWKLDSDLASYIQQLQKSGVK